MPTNLLQIHIYCASKNPSFYLSYLLRPPRLKCQEQKISVWEEGSENKTRKIKVYLFLTTCKATGLLLTLHLSKHTLLTGALISLCSECSIREMHIFLCALNLAIHFSASKIVLCAWQVLPKP